MGLWMGLKDLATGWVHQCIIRMHIGKVWIQSGQGIFKRNNERWKENYLDIECVGQLMVLYRWVIINKFLIVGDTTTTIACNQLINYMPLCGHFSTQLIELAEYLT